MSNKLILRARAKINLALDVLYKRSDGYHEVAMVMQSVSLADVIGLREQADGISVSTSLSGLDCGPSNLAYRAAELLMKTYGIRRGVKIELEKHIPIAAGLAGGSSDAAAVLTGLNRLWRLGLSLRELAVIGAQLGSDIPFCIYGGTMLATGRGEVLRRLADMPPVWLVLAKPSIDVSTAWVYGNYRPELAGAHPDIPGMERCLDRGDLPGIANKFGNALESVTVKAYPEIRRLKEQMLEFGALASLMSGSGPTVFAVAPGKEQAEYIADKLRQVADAWIMITESVRSWEEEDGATFTTD